MEKGLLELRPKYPGGKSKENNLKIIFQNLSMFVIGYREDFCLCEFLL